MAVELAEGLRAELARLQGELRQRGLSGLRWARPEGIHLTLKFLGETPAERVPGIQDALAEAVAGMRPFRLALDSLGTFGGGRPRVLWVEAAGDVDRLREMQGKVERALSGRGFPAEERPFSPHLTLARVPPERAAALAGRLTEALAVLPPPAKAEMEVREVSLVSSTLLPGGAVYERLAAVPLA